jgi:hypothetical protein
LPNRVSEAIWQLQPQVGQSPGGWDLRVIPGIPADFAQTEELQFQFGSQEEGFWLAEEEEVLKICRAGFTLSWDMRRKSGVAHLGAPEEWQNVLRLIYFLEFMECGGLLFHASSVVRHGQACVFPGVSGAGKTTIVRHSPGMPILSDEISAVQLGSEGGPARAWGTPFYGEWGQPGERLSAPVKGFFFPVKSDVNRVVPLQPEETLVHLLPRICTYTYWEKRQRKLFDLGVQLAEQVPGYLLHFRPEPDFWQVIDAS